LIELLVVIAVIALLAALVLPSLAGTKQRVDSIVCRSNLHQFGVATRTYVNDFEAYPIGPNLGNLWGGFDALFPYVGIAPPRPPVWPRFERWQTNLQACRQSIWICPGFRRMRPAVTSAGAMFGSYAYNVGWFWSLGLMADPITASNYSANGFDHPKWKAPPVPDRDVLAPSDMIEFGDCPLYYCRGFAIAVKSDLTSGRTGGDNRAILASQPSDDPRVAMYSERHGGRWAIVCCDGHAENLRPQDLFDMTRDDLMRRWNRDHAPHRELLPP
jgi:type II secretory pathway pseudopilin PulG